MFFSKALITLSNIHSNLVLIIISSEPLAWLKYYTCQFILPTSLPSQFTIGKNFNSCTIGTCQELLLVLYLPPVLGFSLPASRWVQQLKNSIKEELIRELSASKTSWPLGIWGPWFWWRDLSSTPQPILEEVGRKSRKVYQKINEIFQMRDNLLSL